MLSWANSRQDAIWVVWLPLINLLAAELLSAFGRFGKFTDFWNCSDFFVVTAFALYAARTFDLAWGAGDDCFFCFCVRSFFGYLASLRFVYDRERARDMFTFFRGRDKFFNGGQTS